jgi:hypothetical protein
VECCSWAAQFKNIIRAGSSQHYIDKRPRGINVLANFFYVAPNQSNCENMYSVDVLRHQLHVTIKLVPAQVLCFALFFICCVFTMVVGGFCWHHRFSFGFSFSLILAFFQ